MAFSVVVLCKNTACERFDKIKNKIIRWHFFFKYHVKNSCEYSERISNAACVLHVRFIWRSLRSSSSSNSNGNVCAKAKCKFS